jgi:tight adherence protein C
MNFTGWIAITCLFVAVVILVYRFFIMSSLAQSRGRETLERHEAKPLVNDPRVPGIVQIGRFSLFTVPIVERLYNANYFGIIEIFAKWQVTLIRCGFGTLVAPIHVMMATISATFIGGATVAIISAIYFNGAVSPSLLGLLVGLVGGACLPTIYLNHLAATRIGIIEKRLPFAIEFMLLSMEASSSFPNAMKIYCECMTEDPLSEEVATVLAEIESGVGVQAGLTRLAERLQSDPVTAFIMAVTTGIETGQPIKAVMKVQADASRQHRYQTAEEIAKKVGSQALFPLLLSMIAVMLLMIGPILLKIFRKGLI